MRGKKHPKSWKKSGVKKIIIKVEKKSGVKIKSGLKKKSGGKNKK